MAVAVKDPKVAALEATRSLNPHPEKVADPAFLASGFCDPRDLVQVKYEMVRRVRIDKVPVAKAAVEFGYSRQAYYQAASALDTGGPAALAAGKPGPKGPRKLTEPVMARIEEVLAAEPETGSKALAALVEQEFGITRASSLGRTCARQAPGVAQNRSLITLRPTPRPTSACARKPSAAEHGADSRCSQPRAWPRS